MAHYVEDVAAVLEIMAGHDAKDSTSLKVDIPDFVQQLDQPLQGLRVGIVAEHVEHTSLDSRIAAAVHSTRQKLEALGAKISTVKMPHSRYSVATYYIIAPCEASSNLARYEAAHYGLRQRSNRGAATGRLANQSPLEQMMVGSRSSGFGEEVQRRIMLGTFALSAGYSEAFYKQALRVRRLIANDYASAFEKVDVLLGPTFPTPAFGLGEKIDDPVQMYLADQFTVDANLAGLPAISLPTGIDPASGLPLAIQLQAPQLADSRLLAVAAQLQRSGFPAIGAAPIQ
jgi:aspartyl-tRNA(Asn)/glutamyl-tRNA(Gln) amidotransferase subunit A